MAGGGFTIPHIGCKKTGTLYVKCSVSNLGSINNEDTSYLLARLSPKQCQREQDVGCMVEIPVLIPYKKLFTDNIINI